MQLHHSTMSVHPSQLSLSRMRSDNSERMQGTLTMEFKARSHRPEGDSKDVSRHCPLVSELVKLMQGHLRGQQSALHITTSLHAQRHR